MWLAPPLPGDDCSHFADQRSHRPSQSDPFSTPSLPIRDFKFNDFSTNQCVSFKRSSPALLPPLLLRLFLIFSAQSTESTPSEQVRKNVAQKE